MLPIRVFRQYLHPSFVALILLELSACIVTLYVALRLVSPGGETALHPLGLQQLVPMALLPPSLLMAMGALGLYQLHLREPQLKIALRILLSFGAVAGAVALFPGLFGWAGRPEMALAAVVAFFAVTGIHITYFAFANGGVLKHRVLVLGSGRRAQPLTALRRRADRRNFDLVGFVPLPGEATTVARARTVDLPAPGLCELVDSRRIDEIVVALDNQRGEMPVADLLQCRLNGIRVVDVQTFLERETGKVQLETLRPGWLIFSDGWTRGRLTAPIKRLFDMVMALALLALAWPVMLVAALAIVAESGRPVFYSQERVGLGGRPFRVLKFRSMRADAEADGKAIWANRNDLRVTRVGKVLRKLRVDELPQLFNVLRGDMSLVGPRPERPEFVEELSREIPYYGERHRVKPGITGWAQVCYAYGASVRDSVEKLQYDLYYLKNRSLMFDIVIVLRTIEVVLFGKGAR